MSQVSQPILVLLVEEHPIARDGITPIIESLSDNVKIFTAQDLKKADMAALSIIKLKSRGLMPMMEID